MGSGLPMVGDAGANARGVAAMMASKQVWFAKTTALRPIRAVARQVGLPDTRLREPARLAPACRATIKGARTTKPHSIAGTAAFVGARGPGDPSPSRFTG